MQISRLQQTLNGFHYCSILDANDACRYVILVPHVDVATPARHLRQQCQLMPVNLDSLEFLAWLSPRAENHMLTPKIGRHLLFGRAPFPRLRE